MKITFCKICHHDRYAMSGERPKENYICLSCLEQGKDENYYQIHKEKIEEKESYYRERTRAFQENYYNMSRDRFWDYSVLYLVKFLVCIYIIGVIINIYKIFH